MTGRRAICTGMRNPIAIACLGMHLGVTGCAPQPAVLDCPISGDRCSPYRLDGSTEDLGDPFISDPPSCPSIGRYDYSLDLQACQCEFKLYIEEVENAFTCISLRRRDQAQQLARKADDIYKCRLTKDGCEVLWSWAIRGDARDLPDLPHCLEWPADRRFFDEAEAESCRREIAQFQHQLQGWADQQADTANALARQRSLEAESRFRCYASGSDFCP